MPLPENLLTPIAGEKPAGEDLYYDNLFVLIKEARREDEDVLPEGDWGRTKKKADPLAVVKLAAEALEKRTKDIRLAGFLVESQIRVDGFECLASGIELLRTLQESFWPDIYPQIDEGNDLEMRMRSVETAAKLIVEGAHKVPLTRGGLSFEDYRQSRAVGYEKDATTDAKQAARNDAITHGKLTAEDFDKSFEATPKSAYVNAEAALSESIQATERLDEFQRQAYGSDYPNLLKLHSGLEEIHRALKFLLDEKRKIEPDPVAVADESQLAESGTPNNGTETGDIAANQNPGSPALPKSLANTHLDGPQTAYALIVQSAEFLSARDSKSPVPYLVCAGLRLGETRMQGAKPSPGFAVGPAPEVRQSLRILAAKGEWHELMAASLPILASECARAWLDLHRYIWRAGKETGAEEISEAVVGTMKSLLNARPELRHWTLEDDTGAANPETQSWLDGTVLQ